MDDLQSGDRLSQPEFHRRYLLMGEHVRAELIEGIVFMASPLSAYHGRPHAHLIYWLGDYVRSKPDLGLDVLDAVSLIIDNENEVQPDITVRQTKGSEADDSYVDSDGYIRGAPSFVIEISRSSVSIDLHAKKRIYERIGVREYLVLKADDLAGVWFTLENGAYQTIQPNENGDLESRIYPGLILLRSFLEGLRSQMQA